MKLSILPIKHTLANICYINVNIIIANKETTMCAPAAAKFGDSVQLTPISLKGPSDSADKIEFVSERMYSLMILFISSSKERVQVKLHTFSS